MKSKKWTVPLAAAFVMLACSACGPAGSSFDAADYEDLPEVRFSSFYGTGATGETSKVKMRVPFDDTFHLEFSDTIVVQINLWDEAGNKIASKREPFDVTLKKDALVYVELVPRGKELKVEVTAQENLTQMPFDVLEAPDANLFDVSSVAGDPLEAAKIEYKKRDGILYAYCNSPETVKDYAVNKAMTRHDVSDREVFFTFEHNASNYMEGGGLYYGYRVRNTDTKDIYITVKNAGMQVSGAGAFYGEKEWTQFYNTKFALPDMSNWSESAKNSFEAWYGFSGNYKNLNYQPATYKIPAGAYMYVLGGTKTDSYNGYVAEGGNQRARGSCQNGAVLFEVAGKAEAAFYAYNDINAIKNDTTSHVGLKLVDGRGCIGTDEGAVVDNSAVWVFNDETPKQTLSVTFTNYYEDFEPKYDSNGNALRVTGEPNSKINSTPHEQRVTTYYTHCNVQGNHAAVGTDMTAFHTIYEGTPIIIGCDYYDVNGWTANIGNWMKDYIDTYTFVNRGDKEREVTVRIVPSVGGALIAMVRDVDGKLVAGTEGYSMHCKASVHGDAVYAPFNYTVKVAPHSVQQFHVEYNLMANSYGTVSHEVDLK